MTNIYYFLRAKSLISKIDESYLEEFEKEDEVDEFIAQPNSKKKSGRRGNWSSDNLDDFIDIIVNNEDYVEKLIFRDTKYSHNSMIYEKIRNELEKRSSERGESMDFSVNQLRNKFKKCIGDCEKVALTIKTATGIKKIQREKAMELGLTSRLPLLRHEIPVSLKMQQNLQQVKRMMKRLIKMIVTTLPLRHIRYMYQFDQK